MCSNIDTIQHCSSGLIEYGEKDNFYFNVDIAKEGFKKSDIKWSGLNDNTNWNISNTYVIKILSE